MKAYIAAIDDWRREAVQWVDTLVTSKDPKTRYLHLGEGEAWDAQQMTRWVKQAAKLPGWRPNARP